MTGKSFKRLTAECAAIVGSEKIQFISDTLNESAALFDDHLFVHVNAICSPPTNERICVALLGSLSLKTTSSRSMSYWLFKSAQI